MHEDHGHFRPLPTGAAAVFAAARTLADETGTVEDRMALAPLVGLSQRRVSSWLAVLELRRFRGRALAVRHGARRLWVLCVDGIPGVPSRARTESSVVVEPWKRKDEEWRRQRAQIGGVKRALEAAMRERDGLRAELVAERQRHGLDADPQIVALRADLEHAARCVDAHCERCIAIETRLEVDRPQYEKEVELVDRLTAAELVARAGGALLRALRSQGVGARALAAEAGRALELALAGEHQEAARALERIGRA